MKDQVATQESSAKITDNINQNANLDCTKTCAKQIFTLPPKPSTRRGVERDVQHNHTHTYE